MPAPRVSDPARFLSEEHDRAPGSDAIHAHDLHQRADERRSGRGLRRR